VRSSIIDDSIAKTCVHRLSLFWDYSEKVTSNLTLDLTAGRPDVHRMDRESVHTELSLLLPLPSVTGVLRWCASMAIFGRSRWEKQTNFNFNPLVGVFDPTHSCYLDVIAKIMHSFLVVINARLSCISFGWAAKSVAKSISVDFSMGYPYLYSPIKFESVGIRFSMRFLSIEEECCRFLAAEITLLYGKWLSSYPANLSSAWRPDWDHSNSGNATQFTFPLKLRRQSRDRYGDTSIA
jgi:hypothetical protein